MPATPEEMPERQQGLWRRVGEYWWLALNAGAPEVAWTGKHDAGGIEFSAGENGTYAWSAAFVSYVMRIAGAGPRFPYSASHSDYITSPSRWRWARHRPGWSVPNVRRHMHRNRAI
jgi:hypothetical protein